MSNDDYDLNDNNDDDENLLTTDELRIYKGLKADSLRDWTVDKFIKFSRNERSV